MQEESSNSQNVNLRITSCQRGASQGTYKVFLEDGSSFFISVDFFLLHKLKKGSEITNNFLDLIKIESLFVEAYIKAIFLVSKQKYSTFNLKRKLLSNGFDHNAVEMAIKKMTEQGYLDDYKYATSWVELRLKTKLDSYNSLLAGLINKGIPPGIGKEVLSEQYNSDIEGDIIKKIIDKSCRQGKTSDKITNALLRKGFNRRSVFYYMNAREY